MRRRRAILIDDRAEARLRGYFDRELHDGEFCAEALRDSQPGIRTPGGTPTAPRRPRLARSLLINPGLVLAF